MGMNSRESLLDIFQAGIAAVEPGAAILRHISLEGEGLRAGGRFFKIPESGVKVVGGGKGAAPMAAALESLLGGRIREGIIAVKYGHGLPLDKIKLVEAAHPVPDEAGAKAAALCLETAKSCDRDDLLICLLTGGASALLSGPAPSLSLEDLQAVTSALLACGADIGEINAIRKHISSISGGRLAEAANGAGVITLIVSDVLGDDPASIASGPTVADPSTYADCLKIIKKYGLEDKIPAQALKILQDGLAGKIPETPKADSPAFKNAASVIAASNSQALEAAAKKAAELGFNARILPRPLEGEAADMAGRLAREAEKIQRELPADAAPVCLIAGGETTVTLSGSGKGGRNQEMALAAAIALEGRSGIHCLFAGTDGTDGPTDAAGGFADGQTAALIGGIGGAKGFLKNHDSYEALKKAGAHLISGPTRTNVMDLALIIIEPPAKSS